MASVCNVPSVAGHEMTFGSGHLGLLDSLVMWANRGISAIVTRQYDLNCDYQLRILTQQSIRS